MFVLLSGFTFAQTLDDAWRAGDIYLENEKQGETSYEAKFSSWDIAGKDIELEYAKDTEVTFFMRRMQNVEICALACMKGKEKV